MPRAPSDYFDFVGIEAEQLALRSVVKWRCAIMINGMPTSCRRCELEQLARDLGNPARRSRIEERQRELRDLLRAIGARKSR